jgi:hypothetical protein
MLNGRTVAAILVIGCCVVGAGFAESQPQSLADNWGDYLHYVKIGRFDLAKGYGQAVLQGNPDPAELFKLVEANQQGYDLAMRVVDTAHDEELAQLTKQLLAVVDQGRFLRRSEPKLIVEEIRRLGTTPRGKLMATRRLKDAGEYAVPYMLDAMVQAIQDPSAEPKLADLLEALPQIGRPALRPLVAALQTSNTQVKAEIVKTLGKIGYPQSLAHLKFVAEKGEVPELRSLALASIQQIDPRGANVPAAALFYQLGERYYYHDESLAPAPGVPFGNIWFWDPQANRLQRVEVSQAYFHELMAMRCCEWALKADDQLGMSIGLWLAAFFKAEATGQKMPEYFGANHATALVYATTAGPEYLHQALARAVNDRNAPVALGAVEALAATAGEKSLMYAMGPSQPLLQALIFPDRAVRYSAAIAIANAGPRQQFTESRVVVQNLAEALSRSGQPSAAGAPEQWSPELAEAYTLRSAQAMLEVATSRNPVIDLSLAQPALIAATRDKQPEIRVLAGQVLAYLSSPDAQRAIAAMAADATNDLPVRTAAFESLANSAKLNGTMLPDPAVDEIYKLTSSTETDPALRAAAAAAFGALNLPSQKVKTLILDQTRS